MTQQGEVQNILLYLSLSCLKCDFRSSKLSRLGGNEVVGIVKLGEFGSKVVVEGFFIS